MSGVLTRITAGPDKPYYYGDATIIVFLGTAFWPIAVLIMLYKFTSKKLNITIPTPYRIGYSIGNWIDSPKKEKRVRVKPKPQPACSMEHMEEAEREVEELLSHNK